MGKILSPVLAGLTLALAAAGLGGCTPGSLQVKSGSPASAASGLEPLELRIITSQEADAPGRDDAIKQQLERLTNTRLNIEWIPAAAYDDKLHVLLASGDLPQMLRVKYVPVTISAIQSDLFWEVGPLLGGYKNLAAQNPQYYKNIEVNGRVYGIPIFRDIARAAVIYRKDWLEHLGMKLPATIEEWHAVLKAMTWGDPDGNGRNDTYGIVLNRTFQEGASAVSTRLAVSLGGPNKWALDAEGRFTPEFMSPENLAVFRLFRTLYEEKAINLDFATLDEQEALKLYDAGRAGVRIAVAQNVNSMQDRLKKSAPDGRYDVEPLRGPQGIRVPGELGNNGFYVFPKSAVKTEAELKRILAFLDTLLDEPANTLLRRGIEGKHYSRTPDGRTEFTNFARFRREVQPYRDVLTTLEGYHVPPLKDTPLGEKGQNITGENLPYAIVNPALTLPSSTFSERGGELERLIYEAQMEFILGRIDEAGYQKAIGTWRKNGGDQMIREYEEAYAKRR